MVTIYKNGEAVIPAKLTTVVVYVIPAMLTTLEKNWLTVIPAIVTT